MLLPQLLEAKLLQQPRSSELALRACLQRTVWEPGRLDSMPDLLNAWDVVQIMQLAADPGYSLADHLSSPSSLPTTATPSLYSLEATSR